MLVTNLLDQFLLADLVEPLNRIKPQIGRVLQMGLFKDEGVATRSVLMDEVFETLYVLPGSESIGGPSVWLGDDARNMRSIAIPQTSVVKELLAESIASGRQSGGISPKTIASEQARILSKIAKTFDVTDNYRAMTALKGVVLGGNDGATTIIDLYSVFGMSKVTVDFLLGTDTTDVQDKCNDVINAISDNMLADTFNGVHAFVSPTFFSKLTRHKYVKEAWKNYQSNSNKLADGTGISFSFGGITFERYSDRVTAANGSLINIIADGYGHAFPLGTSATFKRYCSPASFIETVGQKGMPRYIKQELMKFGRGVEFYAESNTLPVCNNPSILIEIRSSN